MKTQLVDYAHVIAKLLRNRELAVFAGAGLSAGAGFVDWASLLAPFAKELKLDIGKERDNLVRLAQFSVNEKAGNRHHLNQALIDSFPTMAAPGRNHELLAAMPIETFWTTNYDKLIETSLQSVKKSVDVKWQDSQLPASARRRDAVVYKMHGDVGTPDDAVLTRDDYESYARKRPGLINALLGDLTVKTFLFIGFSFSDPNLDHVLSEVRQRYPNSSKEHYCILRRVNRADFKNKADTAYAAARQDLFVKDLKRFNITAILVDEYSDITEFLEVVGKVYRRDAVFVSGAIADYSPWGESEVDSFVRSLGELLVEKNCRVVSGLGLGIGNQLVTGAVEKAYTMGVLDLNSFLEVRPFPYKISPGLDQASIWKNFRLGLLKKSGIALFVFGNKVNGTTVPADGMLEEFELAIENGVLVFPIGATGWVSQELARRVLSDFERYFPGSDRTTFNLLTELNTPRSSLAEHLPPLRKLLSHIAGS